MKAGLTKATLVAATLGALALGGCQKSKTVVAENASVEDVASKVGTANAMHMQPGRWESTYKLEKLDITGMPPQAREMMQRQMDTLHTVTSCLTPEQAARPPADFFNGDKSGCTFEHFAMAGGAIDARMNCKRPQGQMTMSVSGTYDGKSYIMHTSGVSEMPGGRTMTVASTMTGRRTGACDGTKNK